MKAIGWESPKVKFFLFILVIIGLSFFGKIFSINPEDIDKTLAGFPKIYACLVFIFLYVAGTFFIWYLKDPLKIIGAIFFGAYLSTFLIYISEIINAVILFNLSRKLGKAFIEEKLRGKSKLFYERLEELNLAWLFLLRLIPLIPYRVLDLSIGLTKISLGRYLLVVVLASLPRIFWLQAILASVKSLSPQKMIDYFTEHPQIYFLSFFYVVITLIFLFKLKKKFFK